MVSLWTRIRYPRLLILLLTFVLAYVIFLEREYLPFNSHLLQIGYIGIFVAGFFFAYGFTAGPATALLLLLANDNNLILAGLIGGLGAVAGDLVIFKFLRRSFSNELRRLANDGIIPKINNKLPRLVKKYLLPVIGAILIASPLPDEIGVSLLANSHGMSTKAFTCLSYVLNTTGIFIVLLIGRTIV